MKEIGSVRSYGKHAYKRVHEGAFEKEQECGPPPIVRKY